MTKCNLLSIVPDMMVEHMMTVVFGMAFDGSTCPLCVQGSCPADASPPCARPRSADPPSSTTSHPTWDASSRDRRRVHGSTATTEKTATTTTATTTTATATTMEEIIDRRFLEAASVVVRSSSPPGDPRRPRRGPASPVRVLQVRHLPPSTTRRRRGRR